MIPVKSFVTFARVSFAPPSGLLYGVSSQLANVKLPVPPGISSSLSASVVSRWPRRRRSTIIDALPDRSCQDFVEGVPDAREPARVLAAAPANARPDERAGTG